MLLLRILLCIVLTCAAWWDLKYHRLPNWLTLSTCILGIVLWTIMEGFIGLKYSLLGFGAGFLVFLVPFLFSGMGGGDVKLMAAVGALVGWPLIVWVALLSCVVALFVVTAKSIWTGTFGKLLSNTWHVTRNTVVGLLLRRSCDEIKEVTQIETAARVPFGAAIAVGTIWAMLLEYLVSVRDIVQFPYL